MFEKLGYEQELRPNEHNYQYIIFGLRGREQAIVFGLDYKTWWSCDYDDVHEENSSIWGITVDEHQAITQQMKELGWIE